MGAVEFDLYVSYNQLAVVDPGAPLNMWTKDHYNQGFSWRTGCAAFRTLSEAAGVKVRVTVTGERQLPDGVVRAISVPFVVGPNGTEIASITEAQILEIPAGNYELMFSAVPSQEAELYEFRFIKSENPVSNILVADPDLNPPKVLIMDAEPAV